jgi:predicted restriction endonuclease
MNPKNGICMCVLHDKAFDKGLLSIADDYRILLSNTLKKLPNEVSVQRGFIVYEGNLITLPDRFIPDKEFIRFHRENIFAG